MKTTAIGSPFSHFLVQTGLSPQTPAPFSGLCSDFEFALVAMKIIRLLRLVAVKRLVFSHNLGWELGVHSYGVFALLEILDEVLANLKEVGAL